MVVPSTEASSQISAAAPAAAPVGQAYCAECKRMFATGEMVPFGEQWICAGCKPIFFQRVREGVQTDFVMHYAGLWVRFVATVVDVAVFILMLFVIVLVVGYSAVLLVREGLLPPTSVNRLRNGWFPAFLAYGVPGIYQTIFVGRFGATIGKMACRLKVVRPDGSSVGYGRAFVRYLAEWISVISLFIGFVMICFDSKKRALHDHICSTRVVRKG